MATKMSKTEYIFFQIIQVSPCNRRYLTFIPTSLEWEQVFDLAKKQALIGICFHGLQKLPKEQLVNLPTTLKMKWLALTASIQKRNELMNKHCQDLQITLANAGFKNCILKGQGMAALYWIDEQEKGKNAKNLGSFRQSGDIDVYVDANREDVIRYALSLSNSLPDWDYKHLHLKVYKDVEVEVHYVPEVFLNLWKNRKLQRWFINHKNWIFDSKSKNLQKNNFDTPSLEFNLFYILLHIYRHFLYEGVGLRQLMDYYFVLRAYSYSIKNNDSKTEIIKTIDSFGMTRFARGIMWVLVEIFEGGKISSELSSLNLFKEDKKEGRYILSQIMVGGNFGHYDERLKTNKKGKFGTISKIFRHNLHLLSHYPSDVIWAPIWVGWHWIWKRMNINKFN